MQDIEKLTQPDSVKGNKRCILASTICVTCIALYYGFHSYSRGVASRPLPEQRLLHSRSLIPHIANHSTTAKGVTMNFTVEKRVRSFVIDYENNRFLKDEKPFRFIAGTMHYFRAPSRFWRDRLYKMKAAGLNTVDTYVEWRSHEPEPWQFTFANDYDLISFLRAAHDIGLLVILRPGPFISADRENGGLPYWISRLEPNARLRTTDKGYLTHADRWLAMLLQILTPFLYENGGPIVMLEVESSYGKFNACEKAYMKHVIQVFRRNVGPNFPLFTADSAREQFLDCGALEGALATVELTGGEDVESAFRLVRKANGGKGPLVVGKLLVGSVDHWGEPHSSINGQAILRTVEQILERNASLILYMFHGGTNFGFGSGASPRPETTSYDYNAPLSESGDPRDLYFDIRDVILRYSPGSHPLHVPNPVPKLAAQEVLLDYCYNWRNVMQHFREEGLITPGRSKHPMSFEELKVDFGYVVYTTTISFSTAASSLLDVPMYRDRAYVESGGAVQVMDAGRGENTLWISAFREGDLVIIVENSGRISSGQTIGERKGILSNVTLSGSILENWRMEALPGSREADIADLFKYIGNVRNSTPGLRCRTPAFYYGQFELRDGQLPSNAFLDLTGWTKGVAFINGFNLGRYWPVAGPQVTLYVPGTVLRPYPEVNGVILLEMEGMDPRNLAVQLGSEPILNGPVASIK